jgi:hypothetical protein
MTALRIVRVTGGRWRRIVLGDVVLVGLKYLLTRRDGDARRRARADRRRAD